MEFGPKIQRGWTPIFKGQERAESSVPFIYLHYFAVRKEFQGSKIGTMMLGNFLDRCASVVENVGLFGVALNALTPRAANLYYKYGFRQRNETKHPLMILPSQSLLDLTRSVRGGE